MWRTLTLSMVTLALTSGCAQPPAAGGISSDPGSGQYCDTVLSDIDMDEVVTELDLSGSELAELVSHHEATVTWRDGSTTTLSIDVTDAHTAVLDTQSPAEPEWEDTLECLDGLAISATIAFATDDGTLNEQVEGRITTYQEVYGEPYLDTAATSFELTMADLQGDASAFDVDNPQSVLIWAEFDSEASTGIVYVCSPDADPEGPCAEVGTW